MKVNSIVKLGDIMREEYNFSKAIKNPYSVKLKKQQITINLDNNILDYFKQMSIDTGIPYQTLINLYLLDCVNSKKQMNIMWK